MNLGDPWVSPIQDKRTHTHAHAHAYTRREKGKKPSRTNENGRGDDEEDDLWEEGETRGWVNRRVGQIDSGVAVGQPIEPQWIWIDQTRSVPQKRKKRR